MAQDLSRATSRRSSPQRRGWLITGGIVALLVPLIIYLQFDALRIVLSNSWLASWFSSSASRATTSGAMNPDLVAGLRIFYGRPTREERNGKTVLPISGTITNPTTDSVPLPNMIGRLLDAEGKEVYSWTFPAPADSIKSGQTLAFDAIADKVPANAENLNIAFDTKGK